MTEFLYNDSELQMDTSLILCIEELDVDNRVSPIDTRLFIGWDNALSDFFIRGKRTDVGPNEYVPYAFHCKRANDVFNFIEFAVDPTSLVNITLYNYNNICNMNDNALTYELFEGNMDKQYEIAGYDNVTINRNKIIQCLKLLKTTYNWDNTDTLGRL
jgi:hypothetical protein